MIAFFLCLVLNAHPDFWLPDEEFDRTNLKMVAEICAIGDGYVSLANSHTAVAMFIAVDLNDAVGAGVKHIWHNVRRIKEKEGRLPIARGWQRYFALVMPRAYHIMNRPPWER